MIARWSENSSPKRWSNYVRLRKKPGDKKRWRLLRRLLAAQGYECMGAMLNNKTKEYISNWDIDKGQWRG